MRFLTTYFNDLLSPAKVIAICEVFKFISPIVFGILLSHWDLHENQIAFWEWHWLFFTAVSFAVFWAIQQTLIAESKNNTAQVRRSLIAQAMLLGAIVGGVAGTVTVLFSQSRAVWWLWIVVGITWGATGFWETYLAIRQQSGQAIKGAVLYFLVFGVLGALAFRNGGLVYLLYLFAVWGVYRVIWVFLSIRLTKQEFNFKEIPIVYKTIFTLAFTYFIAGSVLYVDAWLISEKTNNLQFLFFRYGSREIPLNTILSSSFSAVLLADLSQKLKLYQPETPNKTDWRTMLQPVYHKSRQLIYILFPLALVFMIFSQYLFQYLYTVKFILVHRVFDIILLLAMSRVVLTHPICMALNLQKKMFWVSVMEWFVHVLFAVLLMPYYGAQGVAWAIVIAFAFEKAALAFILYQRGIALTYYLPVQKFIIASLVLIGYFVFKYYLLFA